MVKNYIIGIDAGTSFIKSVLFDLEGNEFGKSEIKTNVVKPFAGWIETDMLDLYRSVIRSLKDLLSKTKANRKDIIGIGITGPGDGTWIVDEAGNPVRNGIYWCDGRSDKIVSNWLKDGTALKAFDISGTSVNTGLQCAQVRWLKENEPDSLKKARSIIHCKDWLFYKFTGVVSSDESDESLALFNIHERNYDKRLFELFGIEEFFHLYPIANPSEENNATISEDLAKELGLSSDLMISSGPMDVSACALGGGAIYHGQACSIIGTASIHEIITDTPLTSPEMIGMTLCHAHKKRWIRLMASMAATPNLDWFLNEFGYKYKAEAKEKGIDVIKYADKIIEKIPVGSNGIIYHPYIFPGGERAPFVSPSARAIFSGLNLNSSIDFMLRSIYEGVGFAMLDCYNHMPIEVTEIILTGGGANSDIWCQIISDITGRYIKIPCGKEYGAKGAALNMGISAGIYKSFEDAVAKTVKVIKSYTPDSDNHKKYSDIYMIYKLTYEKMMEIWNKKINT